VKLFELEDEEEIADGLMRMMEQQTGQKIFTLRILGEKKNTLDSIIIFEDRTVLMGKITVEKRGGKLAARIQGNYI
jgi:hypothetical protein